MGYIDKVALGSTEYDLADNHARASLAPIETSPSTAAHAVGELITVDGVLYRVTAAIAVGDTITTTGSGKNVIVEPAATVIGSVEKLALGDFGVSAYGVDATATNYSVTLTKTGNVLNVNGTRASYPGLANVNTADGTFNIKASALTTLDPDKYTNSNMMLRAGHAYRITASMIAGSVTDGDIPESCVGWFYAATDATNTTLVKLTEDVATDVAAGIRTWVSYYEPTVNTYVGYGVLMRKGSVWNNVSIRFTVEEAIGAEITETVSGDTPTIVAKAGHSYVCSASSLTSLSFTPCAAGLCEVRFVTGTTPTALTVPNTVKWPSWFDPSNLAASTTYDIMVKDGSFGAVMMWA
jgi:hypothetical protein